MFKFKVIVAGSRDFMDYKLLKTVLDYLLKNKLQEGVEIEIVSGTAKGADTLGEKYAIENDLAIAYFKPNWSRLGKRAGFVRNAEMADYAEALVAFWDGESKGTAHMINLAKEKNLDVKIIKFKK